MRRALRTPISFTVNVALYMSWSIIAGIIADIDREWLDVLRAIYNGAILEKHASSMSGSTARIWIDKMGLGISLLNLPGADHSG